LLVVGTPVTVAGPGCSGNSDNSRSNDGSGRTGGTVAVQQGNACDDPPPFEATALPSGFANALRVGSGRQVTVDEDGIIEPLDEQPASHHHFRGPVGRYIDVIRGSTAIAPVGGSVGNPEPIDILGRVGEVGDIHEGYAVGFRLGPSDCDRYLLATYGVTRPDLVDLADGLRLGD